MFSACKRDAISTGIVMTINSAVVKGPCADLLMIRKRGPHIRRPALQIAPGPSDKAVRPSKTARRDTIQFFALEQNSCTTDGDVNLSPLFFSQPTWHISLYNNDPSHKGQALNRCWNLRREPASSRSQNNGTDLCLNNYINLVVPNVRAVSPHSVRLKPRPLIPQARRQQHPMLA